jgi:hypothetical protein
VCLYDVSRMGAGGFERLQPVSHFAAHTDTITCLAPCALSLRPLRPILVRPAKDPLAKSWERLHALHELFVTRLCL